MSGQAVRDDGRDRRIVNYSLGFLRGFLREPPVEDDDLAVFPKRDVFRLQVAVDDAAGVSIRNRLADADERDQELGPLDRRAPCVVGANRLGQRSALDQSHCVKGWLIIIRAGCRPRGQLVNRGDAWVLEPARDAGLV
jgi:hypothetical protein